MANYFPGSWEGWRALKQFPKHKLGNSSVMRLIFVRSAAAEKSV